MSPGPAGPLRRAGSVRGRERGSVLTLLPALLVVVALLAVVVIDLGGHLVAVSRASALADAAALAAVSADLEPGSAPPRAAAAEVVRAGGGRLESCRCPAGGGSARVRVSVAVGGLARPHLGATRQVAEATAVITGPGAPPHWAPRPAAPSVAYSRGASTSLPGR